MDPSVDLEVWRFLRIGIDLSREFHKLDVERQQEVRVMEFLPHNLAGETIFRFHTSASTVIRFH